MNATITSTLKLFSLSSLLLLNTQCQTTQDTENTSPYDPAYEALYPMLVELHHVRQKDVHFLGFDNTDKQEFSIFRKFCAGLPQSVQDENRIYIDSFWNKIHVKKDDGTHFEYNYADLKGPQKPTPAGITLGY